MGTQRALEVRLALESGDMDLVRACRSEPTDEAYPSLAALSRPCAWAFVRDNLDRFKDQAPFGVGLTLLALPLVLLGDERGWRASLNSLLVFGAGWGALFLMAVWARLNVHHFVQFAVPVSMVIPVAMSRAVRSLSFSRMQPTVQFLLSAVVAAAWVWTSGPWAGKPVDDLATAEQNQLLGWMLSGVDMHVDIDGGDQLLDCSGLGVEAALLPKRLNSGLPNFQTSATAQRCTEWIQSPPDVKGRQWLITRQEPDFNGPPVPPWLAVESWVDGPRRTCCGCGLTVVGAAVGSIMVRGTISVIIPAHNAADTLVRCLGAVCGQDDEDFEVLVIDDGSTDATSAVIGKFDVTGIRNEEQVGPAISRNRGADAARGAFLVFTDADCVPPSHWLRDIRRWLEGPCRRRNIPASTMARTTGPLRKPGLVALLVALHSGRDGLLLNGQCGLSPRRLLRSRPTRGALLPQARSR